MAHALEKCKNTLDTAQQGKSFQNAFFLKTTTAFANSTLFSFLPDIEFLPSKGKGFFVREKKCFLGRPDFAGF